MNYHEFMYKFMHELCINSIIEYRWLKTDFLLMNIALITRQAQIQGFISQVQGSLCFWKRLWNWYILGSSTCRGYWESRLK